MAKKELKSEEVLDLLRLAKSNVHIEDFTNSLLMGCVKFAQKCTVFDEVNVEEEGTLALLHRLMSAFSLSQQICSV